MRGKYSWFPIGNMLWNHVNMFMRTVYWSKILVIAYVSIPAYTSTSMNIPPTFLNTGQSFKCHLNSHV